MHTTKRWYAVYTKPRWEKKVHKILQEEQLESYCPLNRELRKWSDRVKVVQEPLFKSYVFVKIGEEDKTRVRMINGVVNFVYWLGKPAIIKEREIATIKRFLDEYENVEVRQMEIKPGEKVIVQRGILMGKKGIIKQVLRNRVEIAIESLGFTLTAYIERSKITRLEK